MISDARKEDYSFTLFEATYYERTLLKIEPKDYYSFGLVDKQGYLTNAGRLFADQHIVYNSRVFCTRWNGLEKGSIFDDALKPEFYSDGNSFKIILKSANYSDKVSDKDQDRDQDRDQDKRLMVLFNDPEMLIRAKRIIDFCRQERSKHEIMYYLQLSGRRNFREKYIAPLLKAGILRMTIPDKPTSKNQKYIVVHIIE